MSPYPRPDPIGGVVPDLRATAAGRDVVVMVGHGTGTGTRLLDLVARFGLYAWAEASTERELHWLLPSARAGEPGRVDVGESRRVCDTFASQPGLAFGDQGGAFVATEEDSLVPPRDGDVQ